MLVLMMYGSHLCTLDLRDLHLHQNEHSIPFCSALELSLCGKQLAEAARVTQLAQTLFDGGLTQLFERFDFYLRRSETMSADIEAQKLHGISHE